MRPGDRVGITTTLPIEVLLAGGYRPVDLNNLFIARPDAGALVQAAEDAGFPRNTCAWIKGIFAVVRAEGIGAVVAVTGGDCSNSVALAEVLADAGVEVVGFSFPPTPSRAALAREVKRLAAAFGTTVAAAEHIYQRLAPGRALLRELDELTWRAGVVTGRENYSWHLRACDFGGDAAAFEKELADFLATARTRSPRRPAVRLALVGVPPINDDIFEFLEGLGAEVVFNETPRQFALGDGGADLADAYSRYTYPYGVRRRIADINRAVATRRVAGLIHYVQAFCYRGIQDILIRKAVAAPVLTLEGERPGPLSGQQRLRLESFVEMLRGAG